MPKRFQLLVLRWEYDCNLQQPILLFYRLHGLRTGSEENEGARTIVAQLLPMYSHSVSPTQQRQLMERNCQNFSLKKHNEELCQTSLERLFIRAYNPPYRKPSELETNLSLIWN